MYQRELVAMEETTQQRAQRLKARARELIRRREAEKNEYAKEQLARQFRFVCYWAQFDVFIVSERTMISSGGSTRNEFWRSASQTEKLQLKNGSNKKKRKRRRNNTGINSGWEFATR